MSTPAGALSPTFSVSSSSSFVTVTTGFDHSDDEIVYSVDDESLSEASFALASDDDFVVLTRPVSPTPISQRGLADDRAAASNVADLTRGIKSLKVGQSKPKLCNRSRAKKHSGISESSTPAPSSPTKQVTPVSAKSVKTKSKSAKRKEKKKAVQAAEKPKESSKNQLNDAAKGVAVQKPVYEEAVKYITDFIANPEAKEHSGCRLALLQAMIIELGLATSSLPASLTAAKAFLKARVFVNIREYLAVRGQGLEALKRIMHPSRKSLVKDIRKKRNAASLGWVKESGLQVLLVQAYC